MAAEWRQALLGDLIELKRGYDLPQQNRHPGSIPIISSSGATDHHSVGMVKGPGVVTGRYGTLGEVFYVREDFWPLNTTLYVRDFKGNDPRFISYFLSSLDFLAYSDKAAVPGLNRNHLHQAEIRFPPDVGEQRAIAQILGALDDKIELNRRMNQTLEAMAQLRFSNLTGSPDAATWPVRFLADVASLTKGVSYRSNDLVDGADTALVTLKSVRRGGGYQSDGLKPYVGPYKPQQQVSPGDVVVAQTDVTQAAEVIGRAARVRDEPAFSVLVASLDLIVIRPLTAEVSREFLYLLLSDGDFHDYAVSYTNGTTVLHLDSSALLTYPLALPPANEMRALTASIAPLLARVDAAMDESRTLASIRQTLLPRLISGEIRVSQAERLLEATPA